MTLQKAKPEAVLFDLDGTLVDTAEEFELVLQAMRTDRNLPMLPGEAIRASVSNGAAALVTLAFDYPADSAEHEQLRQEFLDRYEKSLGLAAKPYPGLRDLISALGTAGIPWGVVTNKFSRPNCTCIRGLDQGRTLVFFLSFHRDIAAWFPRPGNPPY